MRPVFVGNFGYDTRQVDLERLFSKYGVVERVDMKSGYAFVYYEDERDAEDAVRKLDRYPFGYDRRKLSVEWARGERDRARDAPKGSRQRPTKTLFVINFDPIRTRARDLERHFEPHGKVLNVRIRRNFAFVQLETLEDAIKALESTNMSKLQDRVISVEYALRDDDERDERERSPVRGSYGRSPYRRSPSPLYGRSRPSPDYGRRRPSPDYGRPRSPVYDRYDRPAYDRRHSPVYGRIRSRSPIRRSRT
ncbi:serine/arginine-rich splicing factor RS31-like [Silene latifolia]|uniref:serine/arginine-rich splicing factor RS31-like n=1 Tax=Silene latifolia TaxID=37657 RepID=UPI003D77F121